MKYDDASWHTDGNFPEDQPEEHGGTHIALFQKWCFMKGWASDIHLNEEPDAVAQVIDGTMSATEFLFSYCDGKLMEECLSDAGNAFAASYYSTDCLYFEDYAEQFGDLMYIAPESAHDFDKFSKMLDSRFESGVLTKAQLKQKPWWKKW